MVSILVSPRSCRDIQESWKGYGRRRNKGNRGERGGGGGGVGGVGIGKHAEARKMSDEHDMGGKEEMWRARAIALNCENLSDVYPSPALLKSRPTIHTKHPQPP